ncbi:MAG: glutamyl-tRNA reductase, partial [Dermatophilaceae bacterium]
MSLLVIGLSHRTTPIGLLEELTRDSNRAGSIAAGVLASPVVSETVVLSTCNR